MTPYTPGLGFPVFAENRETRTTGEPEARSFACHSLAGWSSGGSRTSPTVAPFPISGGTARQVTGVGPQLVGGGPSIWPSREPQRECKAHKGLYTSLHYIWVRPLHNVAAQRGSAFKPLPRRLEASATFWASKRSLSCSQPLHPS